MSTSIRENRAKKLLQGNELALCVGINQRRELKID
jgi:hypothetical protein